MAFIRMNSLYPFQGQLESVDLFGYATKGVPGIEIIGLGKNGRNIKEKFIFLTKERGIKFPPMRFVLCVEGEFEGKKFKHEEFRYLELPLLLMLWKLSDVLPIYDLNDCFASGKLSIQGEVDYLPLSSQTQQTIYDKIFEKVFQEVERRSVPIIIAPRNLPLMEEFGHIYLEDILGPKWKGLSAN